MNIVHAQTSTLAIVEQHDPFFLERLQQILGLGGNDPRLIAARLIEVGLSFMGVILLLMILTFYDSQSRSSLDGFRRQ